MINETIDYSQIKKIFSNKEEKIEYLENLFKLKSIDKEIPKRLIEIDNEIINTWDYKVSNSIIRKIFKNTQKYKIGKYSMEELKKMMNEWDELNLGKLEWPFHPMAFDQYIQDINTNYNLTEKEKDNIVKKDVVKFRRIKKINTARNDFIEYLIVENNNNVTPTLKHNRGIDFYINGYPYDQKVSRSVTKNFINDYGKNWKDIARQKPEEVAKYLYKYQDEARFGSESRLLIVYLDDDITEKDIYKCVNKTDFNKPLQISFEYTHSNGKTITYNVNCYIVLLSK